MIRLAGIVVGVFFSFAVFGQPQAIKTNTAYDVYDRILSAIGNNNPRAPRLVFKDSKRNPASYNPKTKTITIERAVLEICHGFGKDSLNALAYILAHELGHHYRGHGWNTQYASLDFSTEIDKEKESEQQRIDDETESDIYAGFYSHIAGYDALRVAGDFLDAIYLHYSLPEALPGYPSLNERKLVIAENQAAFSDLKTIFDLANVLMSVGQYECAEELYLYVIDKGFTSREIYNNLGLSYVYRALDLGVEDSYFGLILPFKIDFSTRLETSGATRSVSKKEQVALLFYDAKREFETALYLDPDYTLAKENLFFTDIALTYLGERVRGGVELEELVSKSSSCVFCLKGHAAAVKKETALAKKFFNSGRKKCVLCDINYDFKKNQKPKTKKHKKSSLDFEDEVNGFDMYCKDFKSRDCDLYYALNLSKICVEKHNQATVFKLKKRVAGKTSCVAIQEVLTAEKNIKNKLDIYVGDHENKILNTYSNLRFVGSGEKKYVSVLGKQLTFLVENKKVVRWYYVDWMN